MIKKQLSKKLIVILNSNLYNLGYIAYTYQCVHLIFYKNVNVRLVKQAFMLLKKTLPIWLWGKIII